jgi:hypothetical protein
MGQNFPAGVQFRVRFDRQHAWGLYADVSMAISRSWTFLQPRRWSQVADEPRSGLAVGLNELSASAVLRDEILLKRAAKLE